MKRSKPRNSSKPPPRGPLLPRKIGSVRELAAFQRVMAKALFRPLDARDHLDPRWEDGRPTAQVAAEFVKPNDRLTSSDRLEIYARSYWFRVLDCLFDDYPGVHAVLGRRRFFKLASAYLAQFPSASFSLRNLGSRLPDFIRAHPELTAPRTALALDLARFEWAEVVAFDGQARPPLTADDVLGARPESLRLALQPHLTILECGYPVDDFMLAIKRRDAGLRSEASNAVVSLPGGRKSRVKPPRAKKIFVAVHRSDSAIYYKRLEPEAYRILAGLAEGRTLAQACVRALRDADATVDWSARVRNWFQGWQLLGWFCRRRTAKKAV